MQNTRGAGGSYRNPGGRRRMHAGKCSAASTQTEEIPTTPVHQMAAANRKPSQHQVRVNNMIKMAPPSVLSGESVESSEQEKPSSESAQDAPHVSSGGSDVQSAHLPVSACSTPGRDMDLMFRQWGRRHTETSHGNSPGRKSCPPITGSYGQIFINCQHGKSPSTMPNTFPH